MLPLDGICIFLLQYICRLFVISQLIDGRVKIAISEARAESYRTEEHLIQSAYFPGE